MASVLRILRLQSCIKKYAVNNVGLHGRALFCGRYQISRLGLDKFNISIPTQIARTSGNIRTYAVQDPQTSGDPGSYQLRNKKNVDLDEGFQFVDSILRRGSFLRKKLIEDLFSKVMASDDITPSQTLFLLRCCGSSASFENNETRSKLASKLWNGYQEKGWSLDISHYNALLQVFVESEREFSPLDFLATLQEKSIVPNRITYSRLMLKYCQQGDIEGANKILEFMKEKGLELNEYIFNSLILGNSRANDLEGAVGILDIMKQSGQMPSPDTYATLVQAYAEHNKVEEIEKLIEDCGKNDNLNERTISSIIDILADKNLTSLAEKVFSYLSTEKNIPLMAVKSTLGRLISSGHDELAFKLFKALPFSTEARYQHSYFPMQLAASNLDLYKVVNYCEEIRSNGWNILSYEVALKSYLIELKFDMAMGLIRVMREKNITLKEHYFYPIIVNAAKEHDREKIYNLLEEMVRFEVSPSTEFFSSVLLPALNASDNINDMEAIYMRLQNNGDTDRINIYTGVVEFLMRNYGLDAAAEFVTRYRSNLSRALAAFLADLFLSSSNYKATARLLHLLLPFNTRMLKDVEEDDVDIQYFGIRNFFRVAIRGMKRRDVLQANLLPLLKAIVAEGTYLIPSIIEYISAEIGEELTPEVQEELNKLSDLPLMRTFLESQDSNFAMVGISLRKKIEESEANGTVDAELNTVLAVSLIRQRKIQEVKEVLDKLKSNGISLSVPIQIMLTEMYIEEKMYEEAESTFNAILDENPDLQISAHQIMRVARMFAEQGRYEDCIKCLLMNSPENGKWPEEFSPRTDNMVYRNKVYNMLMDVTHKSDLATLKLLQETLLSRSFAPPTWVLPSLILYHIKEDNLDEAMASYVKISNEYHITVGKRELTVACIHKEDTDKIQKILDISSEIHGDMNTLYDLVFGFVETGRLKQAEKVLQTTGLRSQEDKLDRQCEFYLRQNKIEYLDGLITITKGLFNVDRQNLFTYLLRAYIATDDPENALGVWNRMQEENVDPDSSFLLMLNDFLVAKGYNVPFVVPAHSPNVKAIGQQHETRKTGRRNFSANWNDRLTNALDKQEWTQVEEVYRRGKELGNEFPYSLISRVIALLLRNGKLAEATEEANKMMMKNAFPSRSVLKMLLVELEKSGEIATIELLGKYMNDKIKYACFYNWRLATSYIMAGRAEELINKTLNMVAEGSAEDMKNNLFPYVSYRLALEKHPEFYPQLEKLAELCNEKGNTAYYESLYEHHFLKGNNEEAEKIYNGFLKDLNHFRILDICSHCVQQNDVGKLKELLDVLDRKSEGRERIKGVVYSSHIDVLSNEANFEEALKVIESSLQNIKLEDYRTSSLINLEKQMKNHQLSFPYKIPEKQSKESSSSSSSSSDDEK